MIVLEGVTKRFSGVPVLEEVTAAIEDGSIYGLVGYNGAGKTTLLKTVAGIYRAEDGRVLIDGQPVYENESCKRQMFLLTEEVYFLPQASLETMARFYRGYYPNWSEHTFHGLIRRFHLDSKARIGSFSKGMQRQAGLLLALSTGPRYLLLDEAFDGLDLAKRSLMKRLLKCYVARVGATVLTSSHNLRELEGIVDTVGMIENRHLVLHAPVEEMRSARSKYRFPTEGVDRERLCSAVGTARQDGTHYVCILSGEVYERRQQLEALGAQEIQVLPITLEEFFLNEREEDDDDFDDLF